MSKRTKAKKKKLFEIVMKSYKAFYVEAESEEEALSMEIVDDESSTSFSGEFRWEHESTEAKEVFDDEAAHIRMHRSNQIATEE